MAVRTNYQTTLTIDTATPISEGKMRPDGGDIRIYEDAAHTVPLDFYIDPTTLNTTSTKVYIKQDLPTGRYHAGIAFYWPLDGDATELIAGEDGTVTGAASVAAQVGNGYEFDGTGTEYITLTNSVSTAFDNKSLFTFEGWIKRNSTGVVQVFMGIVGASAIAKLQLRFTASNEIAIVGRSSSGDSLAGFTTTSTFSNTDRFYHVVASLNFLTTSGKIWVDGVSQAVVGSPTYSGNTFYDGSNGNSRLGDDGAAVQPFDGILDNVAIYFQELTDDQVRSSYLRGLAGKRLQEPTPSAYWTFNSSDNAGSEVVDLVSGYNGTLTGGVIPGKKGRVGQGMDFDGSSGYITMGDLAETSHTGASGKLSICATITPENISTEGSIFSKYGQSTNQREFYLSVKDGTGELKFTVATPTASAFKIWHSTTQLQVGNTYHVALTYDNSAGATIDKIKMYIDGVEETVSVISDTGTVNMSDTTSPVTIGVRGEAFTNYFNGKIEDVFWSSDSLSASSILELARRSKEGLRPDLTDTTLSTISYWSLDNKDIGIDPQDVIGQNHADNSVCLAVPGQSGPVDGLTSFLFSSATTGMDCGDSTDFDAHLGASGVMTLAGWFKISSFSGASHYLLSKYDSGLASDREFLWFVENDGNYGLTTYRDGVANGYRVDSGAGQIQAGQWYHLVAVYDNSLSGLDKIKLFVNGEAIPGNLAASSGTSINNGTEVFRIGSRDGTPGAFDGNISAPAYYSEALTTEQIKDLYEKGLSGAGSLSDVGDTYITYGNFNNLSISNATNTFVREITGLVHSYQFDEESGGDVLDNTGGITGSISGSVVVENGITGLARKIENSGSIQFSDQIIPTGNASLLLSFRTTNTDYVLLSNYDGVNTNTGSALEVSSSGVLVYRNSIGAGSDNALVTGSTRVDDGKLHTVIITKDNSNINLYLDSGSIEGTAAMASPEVNPSTSNFVIGGYTDGTKLPNVSYDELRVFNKVLTTPEVQDLMDYYPQPAGTRVQVRERADPEPSLKIE